MHCRLDRWRLKKGKTKKATKRYKVKINNKQGKLETLKKIKGTRTHLSKAVKRGEKEVKRNDAEPQRESRSVEDKKLTKGKRKRRRLSAEIPACPVF